MAAEREVPKKEVAKEYSSQEGMRKALEVRDTSRITRELLGLRTSTHYERKMAARDEGQQTVERILGPIDFNEQVVPGLARYWVSKDDYSSGYSTKVRIDRPIMSEKEILTEIYKDLMNTIRLREIPLWNGEGSKVRFEKISDPITPNYSLAFHADVALYSTDHTLRILEDHIYDRGGIGMDRVEYPPFIRHTTPPYILINFGVGGWSMPVLPTREKAKDLYLFKQAVQIAEEVAERARIRYENPLIPLKR